jgi:hypothetical protein
MVKVLRYLLSALAGAFVGYVCLALFANLESFQFYTIRSFVTGQSAMSEIMEHPADQWVGLVIWVVFLGCGAAVGVRVSQWIWSRFRKTGSHVTSLTVGSGSPNGATVNSQGREPLVTDAE